MKNPITTDQLVLFGDKKENNNASSSIQTTDFSDPSFSVNKEYPVHRWIPWIAGFSYTFVSDAIKKYLSKTSTVLDPFSGVGTTLFEAFRSGHNVIGFEINPYAAMACRLKLTAHRIPVDKFRAAINNFDEFYHNAILGDYIPRSKAPDGFNTRGVFYSPKVLQKVLIFFDFLNKGLITDIQDLFYLAFAATMVTYSNYSYEPSLSRRTSAGKNDILDFPVGQIILLKLRQMADDMEWLSNRRIKKLTQAKIYNESFFKSASKLSCGSVDLIITSPPYLNNYHYNRNTRPHLYWLGFAKSPKDFQYLEENNFGKYWQTVREKQLIDLDFPNPAPEIVNCLSRIREQNPEKGVYGGNGWANYAAAYFNDCYRFVKDVKRVLRRRATALVVIGNNIIQGIEVPTDKYLARIAENIGLNVIDIHIPRLTRVGNSIIQSNIRASKANKSQRLYEAIVELRKR